ncbi:hypothetical protein GCM10027082_08360 [Comamonas humi]
MIVFQHKQRGLASIEFALIGLIMTVMLLGIFVYWRTFQAQQSLTRAAGDGSRAILGVIAIGTRDPCHPKQADANREFIQQRAEQAVSTSLKQSAMPGTGAQQPIIKSFDWKAACPSGGGISTVSFELRYELPPLLDTMPVIDEPKKLLEKSVVRFASML